MNFLLNLTHLAATATCNPSFSGLCTQSLPRTSSNAWQTGLNLAYAILGAVAVLVIVLAGMRLAFARDNPEGISKSRNTVVYAVIGLVIVASAAAITNLIIGRLGT